MQVLVSDSSILIEFSKREVLDKIFQLEFRFAVPDALFREELIDLGAYSPQNLLSFGLRVESLDAEEVQMAVGYQTMRPALSLVDSFALALAANRGWRLLTEDKTMSNAAESEGIEHGDALWVFDEMMQAGILSAPQGVRVLEAMRDDPRSPVPEAELATRIERLRV